jgi:hypothetical protein
VQRATYEIIARMIFPRSKAYRCGEDGIAVISDHLKKYALALPCDVQFDRNCKLLNGK